MSYDPHARSAMSNILQGMSRLNLSIPTAVEGKLAALDRAKEAAPALEGADPRDLARAALDALLADRTPLDDKRVQSALLAHAARSAQLGNLVSVEADAARVDVFVAALPSLVDTWAVKIEEADADLEALRIKYPDVDPTDPDTVREMLPQDMPLWGRAHKAVADAVVVEGMLASTAGMRSPIQPQHRTLLLADLSAEDVDDLRRTVQFPGVVHTIRAGHRLSLATPAEFEARVARVAQERADAADALAAAREEKIGARWRSR